MTSSPQECFLDWPQFHRDCRELAAQLLPQHRNKPWKGIIGIARGGLIPATIIARELDIRWMDSLSIATYEHTELGEAALLKGVDGIGDGEGYLIVDDLVDSGATAKFVQALLPKAELAVLYAKPAAKSLCQYYGKDFDQDVWIHFPWDCALGFSKPMGAG